MDRQGFRFGSVSLSSGGPGWLRWGQSGLGLRSLSQVTQRPWQGSAGLQAADFVGNGVPGRPSLNLRASSAHSILRVQLEGARGGILRAAAFDELAEDYDADFTHSPVGSALRAIVAGRLDKAFEGAQRVLDLGCGTGEDAIRVARSGVDVLGIDASPAMVRAAQDKARRGGYSDRAQFRCLPIENLGSTDTGGSFDGVLSNFGALNCVSDLPAVVGAVAAKLTPGARLVWVLLGRYVPWEWSWFLLRADPARAWRRLRGTTGWRGLNIAYPAPGAVIGMLAPHFRVDALRPLGVVLPPSYAAAGIGRRPRVLAALTRLEHALQDRSALAYCADHYIIEATRLPLPAPAQLSHAKRSA